MTARFFYSVRDQHGLDHLATTSKRTLCGLPWLSQDTLHGYSVGHAGRSPRFTEQCERCLVQLSVLQHADRIAERGVLTDDDEEDEGFPF